MSLVDFINAAGKLAQNVTEFTYGFNKTGELKELLQAPRENGTEYITNLVKTLTPEQLDQYESEFIQFFAYGIVKPEEKVRALELYAWLKLMETTKYKSFRGFPQQGV